jgi:transcriptional regulator with XRE-family HTH domain
VGTQTRQYAANRIRQLRLERGLSLEALGLAMPSQLTASTVSKLEKSAMALSADYILELSAVLGVSPLEILVEGGGAGTRYVPAIPWQQVADYLKGVFRNVEVVAIPASVTGPQLFAVEIEAEHAPYLMASGFAVVDPKRLTLEDKGWFLVLVDAAELKMAQFITSPPSLLFAESVPEPIGSRPFTVLGRVVYTGQAVV